jgi:amidohydrolase
MFDCVVRGRGTHGAEPHRGDDVIAAACRVVTALHELVGRTVSPAEPAVLSIGSFHGGSARNVLPERVEFSGILRTLKQETRVALKPRSADGDEHSRYPRAGAKCRSPEDIPPS